MKGIEHSAIVLSSMKKHSSHKEEVVLLGKWTSKKLDVLLRESSGIDDTGQRIDFLSRHFLGTPYQESTLVGDINMAEVFVMNLEGVDCFTFLDYIESLRRSSSFDEFKENLRKVRYRAREISFENRNHFFTDWQKNNARCIRNITKQLGGKYVISVAKVLNRKLDGTYFLPGIKPKERIIQYIPVNAVDDFIISELRTGDYVGIYSKKQGLDVSHVGILVKEKDKTYLRHASSHNEHKKVVDQDFKGYITKKPGILVFRSKK